MHFVVTGGAGFIGRHLVRRLIQFGSVTVVDSGVTGKLDDLPQEVRLVQEDVAYLRDDDWREILSGIDCVFHLAAAKLNTPGLAIHDLLSTNVDATWQLFQAAGECGVSRVVFASSLYAYGTSGPAAMRESDIPIPNTVYGGSKLMGESLLRTATRLHRFSSVALRLFFTYGPGQYADGGYKSVIVSNFERMARGESPRIVGDGRQALDYVYIDDVVNALVAASRIDAEELVVNVSSGRPTSILELVELMQTVSGLHGPVEFVAPDWTAGSSRFGDTGIAAKELAWSAQTSLETGLRRTWESMLQRR